MKDYCLEVMSFPAVSTAYAGIIQGGHSYAHISLDHTKVVDLERPVDDEFLATLPEDDKDTYDRSGRGMTSRLLSADEAERLAVAWMKRNAPDDRLVDWWYIITSEGRVIYDPTTEAG